MAESKVKIVSKFVDPTDGVKGNKNPIIFLHAMLCSKEIWTNIPQTVADSTGRRVYIYDARNHGESTHTNESNFKFNVDDLFTLMEQIKAEKDAPEKFILVGHDMGGMTAISAALRKPESFEKVIIVEMYAKRVPDFLIDRVINFVKDWTECVRKLPEGTPMDKVTEMSVENLYKNLEFQKSNEKDSYKKATFSYKQTNKGYDVLYNAEALEKALGELKKEPEGYQGTYNGPAFFFYGTESHYKIADEEKSMKEHFPNAELVPFNEASHFFVADKPDKLAEELGKYINKDS